MKKRVFIPLTIILSLLLATSLSFLTYIIYLNVDGTTIKIIDSKTETKTNIEVSSFTLVPGSKYEEKINLVSSEANTFNIKLKFNLTEDKGMVDYTDLTVKVGEKEVIEKTKLKDVFASSLDSFSMDLSLIKSNFTIIYSMDESIGNEAYNTSMSFNIDIIVSRSF